MTEEEKRELIPIAIDAMGGDHAPAEIVLGAVQAAREGGVSIILVGDPEPVAAELAKHDVADLPISTEPSEGVVEEGEAPATAYMTKRNASIFRAASTVRHGRAKALVSMGSTGATIAAATVVFGTFNGIERAALGGPLYGLAPGTIVMDIGTNLDCKPQQLADYAALGAVFSQVVFGAENPRVALLSVGAEAGKGNSQVKEATALLENSGLNFIGNLEANDIPHGRAEVIVCDGFVGNVVMKLTEGIGETLSADIRELMAGRVPEIDIEEISQRIYETTNLPEAHGGGPLFGVKGVAVVGHGKAMAPAVRRAIQTARRSVALNYVEQAEAELDRLREAVGT
ncbi:MAG: phosphate acyltransferase PlsX [Dehalococcoidia bacterium]|nr:phosphate acyltransferase PlsX [Dehalococcoidia bacterium]